MKPSAGWRFPLKRRGETAVVGAQQAGRVMKPSAGWRFPLKRRGKTAVVGEKAKTSAVKPPAGGSLLKTESINHLQDQSLSDSELRERKNRSVLQNTYILFGRAVRWHQRFGLVPQMELLAWLAQVYQAYRSGRSRKPWGLAYRGLLGELPDKQPDREFSERPWLDLPASFLRACGLPEYAEQAGEVQLYGRPKPQPQPQPQGPAAGAQQPPALFASDEEPQDWPGPQDEDAPPAEWNPQEDVLSRTWSLLLENVKDGMPRSTFEAYLKHTRPQRWDECRGEYWVQAGSDEAAQWLESRLMQTASRILSGMFNRPVKVCFICDTQERPSNAILGENMPTKNM